MRLRVLLALLVLPLAACGGGADGPTGASASCAARLRWHGTDYAGVSVGAHALRPVRRLGRGVVPGCADTGGNGRSASPSPSLSLRVWRIRGVSPRLAVMVEDQARTAYVSRRCRHAGACRELVGG